MGCVRLYSCRRIFRSVNICFRNPGAGLAFFRLNLSVIVPARIEPDRAWQHFCFNAFFSLRRHPLSWGGVWEPTPGGKAASRRPAHHTIKHATYPFRYVMVITLHNARQAGAVVRCRRLYDYPSMYGTASTARVVVRNYNNTYTGGIT